VPIVNACFSFFPFFSPRSRGTAPSFATLSLPWVSSLCHVQRECPECETPRSLPRVFSKSLRDGGGPTERQDPWEKTNVPGCGASEEISFPVFLFFFLVFFFLFFCHQLAGRPTLFGCPVRWVFFPFSFLFLSSAQIPGLFHVVPRRQLPERTSAETVRLAPPLLFGSFSLALP